MSTWIGWTVGMSSPVIATTKGHLQRSYSYLKALNTGTEYLPADQALIITWQSRVNADIAAGKRQGPAIPDVAVAVGAIDWASQVQAGTITVAPKPLPLVFTVEGHQSDLFTGPVADTATQLEREGLCHHLPTGYNNGAVPFDNASGVTELARRFSQIVQDNGVPFPAGTKWMLDGFSQGMIVVYDFCEQYLMPGKPLAWRMPDCLGMLYYGNPCRALDSIAPWAAGQVSKTGTHGLDPLKRFGLPGCVPVLPNCMDDYREGDIFAENTDDKAGQIKAAVYQAVARGDVFSNPYSLAAEIGAALKAPVSMVLPILMAIISGISFLGDQPNPHYSPYDITGGLNWSRQLLAAAA